MEEFPFDSFTKCNRPLKPYAPATPEMISRWEGKVEDYLIREWKTHGLCSYANGCSGSWTRGSSRSWRRASCRG
jgi:hypothetical protein